ncbi:hypothetical protein ONZ43_g6263 [Nemania bipapillata]|uniref:Uncharacterized protein n=1 Tax=Nemania bipapillata TaxID=110536 RepID=A0ACC2I0T8_9PEZI|nr:hypothetical protein ONZ43_g6263 [Nemania bipapillata]
MDSPEHQPVKREPSAESEASNSGSVKPEPSDASTLSQVPFRDELSRGGDESNEANYLGRLCNENTLQVLEPGVEIAVNLLGQLREALSTHLSPDVDSWLKTILDLEKRTGPTRTVVGVVGNTGAGKSSVINALLDEERLLPTNCLRACTASPTEISFNDSDDPQELYRAEIEFISTEDWTRELQVLFSDLLDGSGQIARDATKADSDAGIAYAKVKAVYPQKTREMLATASPKDLADEPAVRNILGTTKRLRETTAKRLYQGMQHYVDSKEKSTGPIDQKKRVDIPMEYWPLIKVVRIFTKAYALSTGAVIVDLPGVQDSNAARAAVAANYMKSCTGLWIVAPITRAVDDKTAKTLLGDTFKRQLKYDGTYATVSFICSKTDDISITEAAESLGLEGETTESWEAAEKMRKAKNSLQSRISDLKKTQKRLSEELEECETQTDQWEDLQSQRSCGETVYEPAANPRKRRRGDNEDEDVYDSGSSDKENSQLEQSRKLLSEADIEDKLTALRMQRKNIRTENRSLQSQIAEFRREIDRIQDEREKVLADVKAVCIQGRNNYSRAAIRQDFAMGVKELDQENAIEEDDEAFDPDQDKQDYDEIARRLPVFCVSSRAYQKLSGKLEKDDFQSHGFLSVEDTEIPKLQAHARKLTEAGRLHDCRRFLNDLSQLVNSLKLWSANDGTGSNLTDSERRTEEQHLQKLFNHLEEELESLLKESMNLVRSCLREHIFERIMTSMPEAIAAAPKTAYSWGAPRAEGGLFWATYKATVRRLGVYSGASGPRDFNQDLFDPISRDLANGWERAFQRRLPAILDSFAKKTAVKLQQFHQTAKARAEQRHTNITGLVTLSNQILAHIRTVQELPVTLRADITEIQREASRQFTPIICEAMTEAYDFCTNEHGQGSYARMKEGMIHHVDHTRHSMFHHATEVVKGQLEGMCRVLMRDISEATQAIFDTIYMDYMRTLASEAETRETTMDSKCIHDTKAHSGDDAKAEESESLANEADELMQAHIRKQDSIEEEEEEEEALTSDDEFPDVMDLIKRER